MNQRLSLFSVCLILLVSLAAAPVLAATVSCPSSCSCLLPDDAKKLGFSGYCGGKQQVCATDSQKNEKYCYEKTIAAPQLIITAYTLKPTATTATIAPQKCAAGCTCLSAADGKGRGLPYCGNRQTICGYAADKAPLYCFAQPAAPATSPTTIQLIVTGLHVITPSGSTAASRATQPCSAGCTCLAPDKADAAGYNRCSGASVPCDYDPVDRPMYCYAAEQGTPLSPVPPGTTEIPASGGAPVPVVSPVAAVPAAAAPLDNVFAAIGSFFALLFGAQTPGSMPPESSSLAPVPCNGVMTYLLTDPHNCGACGVECSSGSCTAGQCPEESAHMTTCGPGSVQCNGTCTYIQSDDDNCGSCGNVCPDGTQCCSGRCIPQCRAGETCIDGWCRNTSSDPSYCGETWQRCEGRWPACCNGICADVMDDEPDCGECGHACGSGETCCSGSCTSIMSNSESCGACGHLCPLDLDAHKRTTCCNGSCCPSGSDMCCQNTCCDLTDPGMICCASGCANLHTDEQNCGRCGDACRPGAECRTDWTGTACRWHLSLISLHCNDAQYQHDSVLVMVNDTDRSWQDYAMETGDTGAISATIGTAFVPSPAVVHLNVNDHSCGDLTIDISDSFDFDENLTHTFECSQGIYDGRYTLTYRVYYYEE